MPKGHIQGRTTTDADFAAKQPRADALSSEYRNHECSDIQHQMIATQDLRVSGEDKDNNYCGHRQRDTFGCQPVRPGDIG